MGNSSLNDSLEVKVTDLCVTAPTASEDSSLIGRVLRGVAWNAIGTVAKQGVMLGATVIVARLLSPTDYAIGGLALSILGFFTVLAARGFAQALVQREELTQLIVHSVFWAMGVGGLGVSGLAVMSAPWLAGFYGQPSLVPLIWLLALALMVNMIGAVPLALLQREMRFREINLMNMVGGVLSAGVGIGLAWRGYGYWALVAPSLGIALTAAVGAFWFSGYHPALMFRWREFKSVSLFGFSLLGSNVVQYLSDNSDYLIMGRFWSPADFGQYYFAFERSRQPFNLIYGQLSAVLFPAFSQIQTDHERMRRAFSKGTRTFCLVIFPLHMLLIGWADPLVPWLFGEQWRPAIPVFQIFASFAFVRSLAVLVSAGILALGRAQAALAFNLFRVAVTLPVLLYLGVKEASVLTVSIVLLVIWTLQTPLFIGYLYRQIHLSWSESLCSLRTLFGATAMMGLALLTSRWAARLVGMPTWLSMVSSSAFASVVFVLLAWRLLTYTVRQVRSALIKSDGKDT